ncbi:MAG: outer membrane protein assembly factor BamD [Planctomycetota bacterium]|nr:outer membrane protein assembly factor BamD [Planctomycetota bacterium]
MSRPAWNRIGVLAATGIVALTAAAPSNGQATTFRLGEGGDWEEVRAPELGGDEYIIASARRMLADGDARGAINTLDDWIETNETGDSRWLSTAYLTRADALLLLDREFKALYDYEALIREFPQSEEFLIALEREFEIALRYLDGLRIRVMGLRLEGGKDLGVELLIRIQERAPGSAIAEQAAISLADYYYRTGDWEMAAQQYEIYIVNFPQGPNLTQALERRILSNIARFEGPSHDASMLLDAKQQIRAFEGMFPAEAERTGLNEELVVRIDESMAAQELETAEWYLTRNHLASARFILRRLVASQPRTRAATRAIQILDERGWLIEEPEEAAGEAGENEGGEE